MSDKTRIHLEMIGSVISSIAIAIGAIGLSIRTIKEASNATKFAVNNYHADWVECEVDEEDQANVEPDEEE